MRRFKLAALCISLIAASAFAVYLGLRLGTNEGEKQAIAAWVQAVGSVAAIAAGAWFIHHQALLSERHRIEGILAILDVCIDAMLDDRAMPEVEGEAYNRFCCLNPNRIRYGHDNLVAIPLYEIRSKEVVRALSEAVEAFRELAVNQVHERMASDLHPQRIASKAAAYRGWHNRLIEARRRIASHIGQH